MTHIRFYSFSADWYNECTEKDAHSNGIVAAGSMAEAVEKISSRLPYTDNVHIQELDDMDFIFLDNEHFDLIQREGIGAFDIEDEDEDEDEDEENF